MPGWLGKRREGRTVDDAAHQHVVVADKREIVALVELENVPIVHAWHVVRVLTHRLANLLVSLLGLLLLLGVGDAHGLRQALGKEGQHHDQNNDREERSDNAGEEQRTFPDPGELLNQTREVSFSIAKEAAQTGTYNTMDKERRLDGLCDAAHRYDNTETQRLHVF